MTSPLRVGSICSGVDGMALGVLAAFPGAELVWHAEVDPHASLVLARHWPEIPNLGDVRCVDWSAVEPVDLLIGGPPCQAVSSAGKRKGWADDRWLWPEAFRAMAELAPSWCLWENPMGLLTGRPDDDGDDDAGDLRPDDEGVAGPAVDSGWFGHVLGEMAALGYVGRWGCLRSSDAGAPHRRERVFIAADAGGAGAGRDSGASPVAQEPARRREPGDADAPVPGGSVAPDADRARREGFGPAVEVWRVEPAGSGERPVGISLLPTPQAADGSGGRRATNLTWEQGTAYRPSGAKASVSLREAVDLLPTPRTGPNRASRRAAVDEGNRCAPGLEQACEIAAGVLPREFTSWGEVPPSWQPGDTADHWGRYAAAVARWEQAFGEPAPAPTDDKGRLNPDLPRWMLGFPPGWVDGLPRTAQLRVLGNSCQPQVAYLAARMLLVPVLEAAGVTSPRYDTRRRVMDPNPATEWLAETAGYELDWVEPPHMQSMARHVIESLPSAPPEVVTALVEAMGGERVGWLHRWCESSRWYFAVVRPDRHSDEEWRRVFTFNNNDGDDG